MVSIDKNLFIPKKGLKKTFFHMFSDAWMLDVKIKMSMHLHLHDIISISM